MRAHRQDLEKNMQYKVKSQLYSDQEAMKQGILDDCGPSSVAAAVSWASGYTVDYTAAQGVAAKAKATGRVEKQGASDNGSSLPDLAKTVTALDPKAKARYAKSWEEAVAAAKQGAAIMVWVQQPIGYPAGVKISAWHDRWAKWWGKGGGGWKKDPTHFAKGYGHMTSAGWDPVDGWMWACPTRDDKKAAEKFGAKVTEEQLKQIADSKRVSKAHVAPVHKHLLIVTHSGRPKAVAPVAPTPVQPAAPAKPAVQTAAPVAEGGLAFGDPAGAPTEREARNDDNKALIDANETKIKASFAKIDVGALQAEAARLLSGAADAARGGIGMFGKIKAGLAYVTTNSQLDEMLLDAVRTFITVSISVALGLGIPLLDIQGSDFRVILSAGLASALQIVVKALDPQNSAYGIKRD